MSSKRMLLLISTLLLGFACASRIDKISSASPSRTTIPASEFSSKEFDVIIIGGGNAGVVLASRLTAPPICADMPCPSPLRVGVIEAGLHRPGDPLIDVPTAGNLLGNSGCGALIGNPSYDWKFQSVPQDGLDGAVLQYPRGRVLGGSTAIHSMVWQRGNRDDYDAWAYDLGNGPGWSFDRLLPYLRRSESYFAASDRANPLATHTLNSPGLDSLRRHLDNFHGHDGPVQVSHNSYQTALERPASLSLLNALSDRYGHPFVANYNPDGGDAVSVPLFGTSRTVSPHSGLRSYAASAYLDSQSGVWGRPHLSVVTGVIVTHIVFRDTTARSVKFVSEANGTIYEARVAEGGEVILCAGAIQSPQILELSGIGNRTRLENLNISVVLDLPGVGENLQDHPVTLSDFSVKDGVETLDWLALNKTHAQLHKDLFEAAKIGALTYTAPLLAPIPLRALLSTTEFAVLRRELDISISHLDREGKLTPFQRIQYNVLRRLVDEGNVGWVEMVLVPTGGILGAPIPGKGGATVIAIQLYPFGRGSVHINSTNPLAPPLINPNFLPEELPWDSQVLLAGSRFARDWFSTTPIVDFIDKPLYPPASLKLDDDEQCYKYMRGSVRTTNHPLGTTAMAPRHLGGGSLLYHVLNLISEHDDRTGVVDSSLKIYGLDNVRVADAGSIPLTIGVATQATVYALAEKVISIEDQNFNVRLKMYRYPI
ncbi:hypothetical protein K488DRAFT_83742 [Vararia minispora EC-137]|uniref:Uncharacterized protein n=1 Tax=Vararia minispora EC-137 TaxID=1314806 RepID=A0ACB8QSM9_9AGAM|nr:hypothetical protein K488DRAFT_83742 [Vararia minispora EC-137]